MVCLACFGLVALRLLLAWLGSVVGVGFASCGIINLGLMVVANYASGSRL